MAAGWHVSGVPPRGSRAYAGTGFNLAVDPPGCGYGGAPAWCGSDRRCPGRFRVVQISNCASDRPAVASLAPLALFCGIRVVGCGRRIDFTLVGWRGRSRNLCPLADPHECWLGLSRRTVPVWHIPGRHA